MQITVGTARYTNRKQNNYEENVNIQPIKKIQHKAAAVEEGPTHSSRGRNRQSIA